MKNDSDPLPLRNQLTAWHNSEAVRRRFHLAIEKARVGDSVDNPIDLPDALAKRPAAERFEWALSQLSEERKTLAWSRREQELGAGLRARLVQLKAKKETEERAVARKRLRRLSVVTAVFVALAAIVITIWWQLRPLPVTQADVERSLARLTEYRGVSLSSVSFQTGPKRRGIAEVHATIVTKINQPLFMRITTERYLLEELKLDLTMNRRIVELTAAKEGRRILELAGLSDPPFNVTNVTLLKMTAPAGTTFNGRAMLYASEKNGSLALELQTVDLGHSASLSVPVSPLESFSRAVFKESFRGAVFDVGNETDRARLRALVDEQPKLLARLETARGAYVAEVRAQHKSRRIVGAVFPSGNCFHRRDGGANCQ